MTKRNALALLIVVAVLIFAIGWINSGQASTKGNWEYKTVYAGGPKFSGDATLNELGAQGWELAGVAAWNFEGVSQTTLYFKRAR